MGKYDFLIKRYENPGYEVGSTVLLGRYFFANEKDFRPIKWTVLESGETEALLISTYCLEAISYGENQKWGDFSHIIWENSVLRNWLNTSFYGQAFNGEEKERILETTIVTDDSTAPETHKNKVFLLSEEQALSFFADDEARQGIPTPYLEQDLIFKGYRKINEEMKSTVWWLLPHIYKADSDVHFPCAVFEQGKVLNSPRMMHFGRIAVRPVIRIKK